MIQRTVEEQQRQLYWHRQRQAELRAPRVLLREADELMFWLEECLVQRLRIVPGWLLPRLVALLAKADPALPGQLGRERRPAQVMELLFQAQERLMEQSVRARRPARIIPLFRSRR
jgi:hypothetical protein